MRGLWALVVVLTAATSPLPAQPAGNPVANIQTSWKKRKEAFESVRYVVTGKVEVFFLDLDDPELQQKVPKMPVEYPYRAEVLLHIPTGRFSFEGKCSSLSVREGRFVESSGVTRFDGKRTMSGVPPGGTTPSGMNDVTIRTGYLQDEVFTAELWPLFDAHGIIPSASRSLSPRQLTKNRIEDEYEYRGQVKVSGIDTAVLRSELVDSVPVVSAELSVDTKRDAAVVRHTYFSGKNPVARLDVTWKPEGSTWLPSEWTCTWTSGGKVQSKNHLRVERVDLNPAVSDDEFRYPLRPGMKVAEYDTPAPGTGLDPFRPSMKKYVVGEGGGATVLEETGKTTLQGEQLPPESRDGWIWWVVGVGVAVLVIVVLAVLGRRFIRKRR